MKTIDKIRSKLKHPLAKKNPVKAFIRLGWLNVINALYPNGKVLKVFGKTKYLSRKGSSINRNFWLELADYEEFSFLKQVVKSDDAFIDIGANVGEYTLFVKTTAGCTVHAFEPNKRAYEELRQNIALNHFEDIYTYNVGLGEEPGELLLTNKYGTANHVVLASASSGQTQALESIAVHVLADYAFEGRRLFMKMDVEGYEYFILKGAAKLLADQRLQAIIIELTGAAKKFGVDEADVHGMLLEAGFIPVQYLVKEKKLVNRSTYNHEDFNTIYIRKNAALL
jgi:FkbM family methyltransferase